MAEATGATGTFKKDLSWFSLLTMSLGTVIGSGWLMLPGIVASKAGPAGVLDWMFGGLAMLVVALVFAELGAAWPSAGAVAKYPYLSHGSFVGHLAGWAALISYAIIPPAEAVAVTRYAASFLPALTLPSEKLSPLGLTVATTILVLISLLNYFGVKYLGAFQNWVTTLKYIPILFFLGAVGFFAFHARNFTAFHGFSPGGPSGLMLGVAATLFAYTGFRQALDFGAEAKNPGRDLPLAVVLTIVIATLTYTLIALVFVGGIRWGGLAHFGVQAGDWGSLAKLPAPLYDVTLAAGIGAIAWLIFVDGIVSPNGPNATNVGSVPRVAYTMAEGGTMPAFFLRLHPVYGTPDLGLLACFAVEEFFLLLTNGGYGALISAVSVSFMVGYSIGPVSMGTLRRAAPDVPRPFRLKAAGVLAPLAFVISSLLLYWSEWPETGETLGVLFVGVLVYLAYGLWGGVRMRTLKYGVWFVVYLAAMALFSYLGSRHFGGKDVLPFGWDMVLVSATSLALYYWGIRQGLAYWREMGDEPGAGGLPSASRPSPGR
ncbi:MAG: APC family permease [Acidobacteriota bacterium]